jgi:CheY-like chemotaxis protein
MADVDLTALAREAVELLRPQWSLRTHPITVELEPGVIPATRGDAGALREVLASVLVNAIEALPGGGRIAVKTWTGADGVFCSIADNGTGMSDELRARAPEPFFTTKGPKGTGLGLSASYGILAQHGGELSIVSAAGGGTTVTIRLPHATPPNGAAALRVLLVDDDSVLRHVLGDLLLEEGHQVSAVAGGRDALAHLERGEPIDVVITDLAMPGMSGWEVARAVKARWPKLPVVLVTGWGEAAGGNDEERAAVDVMLAKPVTLEALRAMTQTIRTP